jgi:hypothetical protein
MSDLPTTPGFGTELLILDSSENDGILLKPWPRTRDSEDTINHSMTQESDPARVHSASTLTQEHE